MIVDYDDYLYLSQFKFQYSPITGYVVLSKWNKETKKTDKLSVHRIIARAKMGQFVDHKNGNKLDNRKENLRICTNQQNSMNQKIQCRDKSSKYKGVLFRKDTGKWSSRIKINGKFIYLGCFEIEEDAAIAYNIKAVELFKEFAHLNEVST